MTAPRTDDHQPVPRVALYASSLGTSYADQFIWRHARALEADVLTSRSTVPAATVVGPSWQLARGLDARMAKAERRLRARRPLSWQTRKLAAALARADVVYSMFLWSALDGWPAVRVARARRPGLRFVVFAAGSDVAALERTVASHTAQGIYRRMLDDASVILAGSDSLRRRLVAAGVEESRVARHYIGIEVPDGTTRPEPVAGRVTAVSRLVPVKGVDKTIEAFAVAVEQMPHATLRIIGDGPLRPVLERRAVELDLGDSVEFMGELPHDRVLQEMGASEVFVQHNVDLPNHQKEGLGGSILEAQACGVPVVVADSGGVSEAILDGETGVLVPSGDVVGMGSEIAALLRSPTRRAALGSAGRAFVGRTHNAAVQDRELRMLVRRSGDGEA